MRKKGISLVANYWQSVLTTLLVGALVVWLVIFKLASLVPLVSSRETAFLAQSHSLETILLNPLFCLIKLPFYGLRALNQEGLFTLRAVSAFIGVVGVGLMYYILSNWHSRRIAMMGLVLFTTSSWFLSYARLLTPDILYPTLLLMALAYGVWTRKTKHQGLHFTVASFLTIAFIYTPGLIWFVLFVGLWQRKNLLRQVVAAPKTAVTASIIALIFLAPLGYAIYQDLTLLKPLFGLPAEPLEVLQHLPARAWDILGQLIWHRQSDPSVGLIGLALLDMFTATMVVLGAIGYYEDRKLDRTKMIIGASVLSFGLVSLGGPVSIAILLPLIYILASQGLSFLLVRWFSVFPRNPLARAIGLGLLSSAIALTMAYHLTRYFIAWPQSPATRAVFTEQKL